MAYVIVADYVSEEVEVPNEIGKGDLSPGLDLETLTSFRLYDGDDILYYEGIADSIESVLDALDYYEYDSGTTHARVWDTGVWRDV